ncbi:alpha/beta fold hydrolase [Pediococcus claussenii]|uniref:Alpha/beta hydrolase family protein n=1 Tax=Pediococcus claussenii (strain ATCC BAA-344 / DSM 14800 / JCM 18046 / KCTC 3811 / LMG 21948 / P06) TaxID=701521 RepID=G8PAX0_PEDCP|nr:alpha/beta hydrolase [Pediococcus claussenii]AEV95838.1 alpha/beta hydrolase family protein [Pediococcus claussenii ATCC BAA-344]ANZ69335.1 hypothetical protein AYR57_03010 [Pediococcus claussenii]ANZ71155.1 hypothetical protein AYR58_03025 [Pediococcus claussenii]
MSFLTVNGAKLSYNVIGKGPALIFVPGANGTGDIFRKTAELLKDTFTVITYDRRDYGLSQLTVPLPVEAKNPNSTYRIKKDADDVAALVNEVAKEPAYILGSSSGSIVVMETLQDHPEVFKRVLLHESPITVFIDAKKQAQMNNNKIAELAGQGNMKKAMENFAKDMHIGELDRQMMLQQPVEQTSERAKKSLQSRLFWIEYEIRQYTSREIDINVLKENRDKIVLFTGSDSGDSFPKMVMNDLSLKINVSITSIPGGHLGYAQKPEGFAETLKEQL